MDFYRPIPDCDPPLGTLRPAPPCSPWSAWWRVSAHGVSCWSADWRTAMRSCIRHLMRRREGLVLLEVVCKYSECTYLSLEKDETLWFQRFLKSQHFLNCGRNLKSFDFYSKQPCISYLRKKVSNNYFA